MILKLTIMDLNDKLKNTLEELKTKADNLKNKLNLSTADARKEFDIQTEKVKEWMDDNDINSESFKHKSKEAKQELKTMFDELQLQISLGKAEGEDAIKEQSKKVKEQIYKIKIELDKDDKFQKIKNGASEKFNELSDTISILSTKFEYDIEDGKEIWEEKKKEINKEIDGWSDEFEELKNKSTEKFDEVSKEVSSVWNKIKKSF